MNLEQKRTYNHTMPNFDLNISVLEIELTALERIHLPAFPGSKLEGAFGRALYALSCTRTDLETCQPCPLRNICPYGNLYAPSLPESMNVKSLEKPPRPILFATGTGEERTLKPGEKYAFRLILVGRAMQHTPYVIASLRAMGENGIGYSRGRFAINTVNSINPYTGEKRNIAKRNDPIVKIENMISLNSSNQPSIPNTITLEFSSFVHLQNGGSMATDLHFPVLIRALQRRTSNLEQLYGAGTSFGADYSNLVQLARDVKTLQQDLRPAHQLRKGVGGGKVNMHGLIGNVMYEGNLEPFTGLLRFGELLGMGKWAHFGAGQYKIFTHQNQE
jgi:CRISPR-associated endoribonuclease Cas6